LKNSVAEHIVYGWQEENDSYYTPTQPKEDVMLNTFNNSPF
jgi:hypothetical protein